MGAGWHVLNPNAYRRDGDLFVAGEIYNQTENALWIASVQTTFQTARGSVVVDAATEVALLSPGRKIAFHANVGTVSYESYSFELLYMSLPPGDASRADLSAVGDHLDRVDGAYRVRGRVENLGAALDDSALVVATLFDGQGRVAGVSSVEIAAGDLLTGTIQAFEIAIEQYAPDATSYEVQVFGF
jgi:hypothetical protein